ncbi:hypothetical protein CDAR_396581 [Caerostris darwini]|uniref:Uncharacterized protein n=1 Tax=Caerostris darwini TaxID=1538125 RepID=A0AAV4PPA1_9ARAC|nr:hypothetical protein CDAR_396581 [Caerostris darwini]
MVPLCRRWWALVFTRAEKLRACERNLGFALEKRGFGESLWCASIPDHPVMKTPHSSADTPTALLQRGADPANYPPGRQTRLEIKAGPAF